MKIDLCGRLVRPLQILDFQIDRSYAVVGDCDLGLFGVSRLCAGRLLVEAGYERKTRALVNRDACAELVSMTILKRLGPVADCNQIGGRCLHEEWLGKSAAINYSSQVGVRRLTVRLIKCSQQTESEKYLFHDFYSTFH